LLINSFVRADIAGKTLERIFKIPRAALHENNLVLTVAADQTMHVQPVSVRWQDTETGYIDQGLEPNDQVIVSNVPAPIEGMDLIISNAGAEQQSGGAGEEDNGKP
jgi:hypothetical protein